ncbi:hypothetical protein HD806DRAFT_439308 [Xylariaceae sp. AK1471]|nr:hypothetical protein HD806DRAFT_439308 [Xylariaceae sp. AK1471]
MTQVWFNKHICRHGHQNTMTTRLTTYDTFYGRLSRNQSETRLSSDKRYNDHDEPRNPAGEWLAVSFYLLQVHNTAKYKTASCSGCGMNHESIVVRYSRLMFIQGFIHGYLGIHTLITTYLGRVLFAPCTSPYIVYDILMQQCHQHNYLVVVIPGETNPLFFRSLSRNPT